MKTTSTTNPAAAGTFQGNSNSGTMTRANGTGFTKFYRSASLLASVAVGALLSMAAPASAQLNWDNTRSNSYVAAGYTDECTAFGHGRFKTLNGEWLRYRNPSGSVVYPNGGLMYDYAMETAQTVYRSRVPVRGALISWQQDGTPGHAGVIERVNKDGSALISEQNFQGSTPNSKTLTASQLLRRPSTVGGRTVYYSLAGYVNPNRAPALGTLYTNSTGNMLTLTVALLDEDNRDQRVLVALFRNGSVVNGSTMTSTVKPNNVIYASWDNSRLARGTYTILCTTTDFKGLKGTKSVNFNR